MAELIYKGLVYGCVLSDEAVEQIGFDGENLPERICGEDSEELWVRIIRYCDGEKLIEPFELNCEGLPFWAVKTARPESLRAYFWHDGNIMVISHFIKKNTQKLTREDHHKMRLIMDSYNRNGGF
ncbi:hypothetical protein RSJ68_03575 [Neisseria sp. DTU_2020_1000833_1_SI_GRL_NUU_006]|nr:hypothetical protein RSJ68_03575 [Neisseria sp. DTU_2020_1000833_1_SI_GRL_NUU_006]